MTDKLFPVPVDWAKRAYVDRERYRHMYDESLHDPEAFRKFSETIKVPLLANMTEFGRTPFMTSSEFEALGYKMVDYTRL